MTAMPRVLFSLLLLCLLQFKSVGQDKNIDAQAAAISGPNISSVDALASYIKQNFTTDSARVRAVYVWIASNINYDLSRLHAMELNPNGPPQPIDDVLKRKYAVCQGYSELFVALCKNMGINAHVVSGYTKQQGKISPLSHAWVSVALDGEWFLFDPTWAAGYVKDDKFYRKFNNAFYKVSPENMVKDHMPYDPVFQFLSNPLTHKEFVGGTVAANRTVFNYKDTLALHSKLSTQDQMLAELRRLEGYGVTIGLLQKRQQYLKKNLQSFAAKDAFEEGGKAFKTTLDLYNAYVGHKNKQFSAIGDNDLKQMVDSMSHYIKLSRSFLIEAVPKSDEQRQAKAGNIANIERLWSQINKEKQFVDQYIAAEATARKQLFGRR